MKKLINGLLILITVFGIVFISSMLVNKPFIVVAPTEGVSMRPTFTKNSVVEMETFGNYKRFDIVTAKVNGGYVVKRIVGMPHDKIKISDGVVYINGIAIKEDYAIADNSSYSEIAEFTLNEGEYYLLGDNRPMSVDSRAYGPVTKSKIVRKVLFEF